MLRTAPMFSTDELRKEWGWYLAVGIGLVALGVLALVAEISATLASVVVYGAIVFVVAKFRAFVHRYSNRHQLHLSRGVAGNDGAAAEERRLNYSVLVY
ncbi:MAG: hypothetical protein ACREM8_12500 [Vulcanimicrobiaceae bacterium]